MSWQSQPVAILGQAKTSKNKHTSKIVLYNQGKFDDQNVNNDAAYDIVRAARKIGLQLYIRNYVLVATKRHGLLVV